MSNICTHIQYSHGSLSYSDNQEKHIKEKQIGKEEVKVFLFTNDVILHMRLTTLENSVEQMITLIKIVAYKTNMQRSVISYYTMTNILGKKSRKQFHSPRKKQTKRLRVILTKDVKNDKMVPHTWVAGHSKTELEMTRKLPLCCLASIV